MAFEGGDVTDLSFSANADLSSNQFYAVKSTGANIVALCLNASGGANRFRGVVQNDPASGEAAQVRVLGYSKWVAGEAVAIGDGLVSSTGGTALVANTTGEYVVGFAHTATTAAGQILTAWINPGGFMFAASTA